MKPSANAYVPAPEVIERFPPISGNTVNGLGETAPRRPSPFFWHDPQYQTHGELQRFVIARIQSHPEVSSRYSPMADRGPKRAPKSATRIEKSPGEWTKTIKEFALGNEADLVGIARMDPAYVYEGFAAAEPWIVMLGIAMDHRRLATAPASEEDPTSAIEVVDQYNRGARAARKLSNFIFGQGYDARLQAGPKADAISLIPPALACGFGELGKHGSIINRTYGSSFRLAAVLTDLPLVADEPDIFGADDFCTSCQVCTNACPPRAILDTKQMVRGTEKWYVDFDRCIPYFADTFGCGICIAVCPWSRPGIAPRLAEKMLRRRATR